MGEPATVAFDADELRLAQLACAKLAGMVQGALSVAVPALYTGVPEPHGFFEARFRVMSGFAQVLHAVSGRPGHVEEVCQLREKSQGVLTALDDLRLRLIEHLKFPRESARSLVPARQAAFVLSDAIGAYARLIQLDPTRIDRMKQVVVEVFEGVDKLSTVPEPSRS